jgi:hypothetical protein
MRIEIPGPSGARLVAVARAGRLTAVLPADKARLESAAGPEDLEALLGVALSPGELMDVLLGVAPPSARGYTADWGETLPRASAPSCRTDAATHASTKRDRRRAPRCGLRPPRCEGCRRSTPPKPGVC